MKQTNSLSLDVPSALTERIVLVLSRMKCPHAIEPFQIQGGDFIHIFPLVQWLVRRVLDRRAEFGDFNRAYTLNQYKKRFNATSEEVKDHRRSRVMNHRSSS